MYARSSAEEDKIRGFTKAIHRRNGSATLEEILIEVSNLGTDEIKAMMTLVESESTDFDNMRNIMSHAVSNERKDYQQTIRILSDNGWIDTKSGEDGLEFLLTDECEDKLDWL